MSPDDPNWPRASAWLAGDHDRDPVGRLAVLGAPVRLGSISGGRFDLAPAAVRAALERFSTYDGGGIDLRSVLARDVGDLELADASPSDALVPLAGAVGGTLDTFDVVVVLGGDNSVTRPACRGLGPLDRAGLLTFDAHHDLRDLGPGFTNGNPVRALLEDGLSGDHVVQVGIQPFANARAYAEVARKAGVRVADVETVRREGIDAVVLGALETLEARADAIYVDLDVDVLDRAFAPASPGARPGGLTPAELQTAARLCGRHPKVRAMDIVEVDPERDVAGITVMAAASFLLAFAAGVASRLRS